MKKSTSNYIAKGRSEVRRKSYEIQDEAFIKRLLKRQPIATIASVHDGQAFVTPVSFVYIEEANALYFHGAKVGRLRANIEQHPQVAVNVFELGAIVPADKAIDLGLDYKSVTVFGAASMVVDEEENFSALQALVNKFFYNFKPDIDYEAIKKEDFLRTAVFRIDIEEWSAKYLNSEDPDKFDYVPLNE